VELNGEISKSEAINLRLEMNNETERQHQMNAIKSEETLNYLMNEKWIKQLQNVSDLLLLLLSLSILLLLLLLLLYLC
jgi:maltodextrin utilization protein YvdJ